MSLKRREEMSEFLRGQSAEVQAFASGFAALRWGVEEVKAFLSSSVSVGGVVNGAGALFEETLLDEVAEAANEVGSGKDRAKTLRQRDVHVSTVYLRMSEVSKQYVRNVLASQTFVEFASSGSGSYNPHPVLRAFKEIADAAVWRMVGHEKVLEIGPNIVTAVMRGLVKGMYRGLVPRGDSLDCERASGASGVLRVKLAMTGSRKLKDRQREGALDALEGARSTLFSRERLQDCMWRGDVMVGLSSTYGIPLADVVRAMHRTGCRVFRGTIENLSPLVEIADGHVSEVRGQLGQTEQMWLVDLEKDSVTFFFQNSATRPYVHRLSTLVEYFRFHAREYMVDGTRYLFRRLPSTNEVVMTFTIERVDALSVCEDPTPRYRFLGREREVAIDTSVVDPRFSKGDGRRVKPITIVVGEESFSRVLQDRMVRGPRKVEEIMNFARTNRVSIVHSGVRVSCDMPIAVDQLRFFSVAVDALATQLEETGERDMGFVREHMSTGGWCSPRAMAAGDPGLGRAVWSRLVTSMAEALPVVVRSTARVVRDVPPCVVLSGVPVVASECMRDLESDARLLLSGANGGLSVDEAEAMKAWLAFSVCRVCQCLGCRESVKMREEEDRSKSGDEPAVDSDEGFFEDAVESLQGDSSVLSSAFGSGSSVTRVGSESVGVSVREEVVLPLPRVEAVGDTWLTPVSRAREAVMEYVDILKGQMASRQSLAVDKVERMLRGGGISALNLRVLGTDRCKHYGIRVGRLGLLEGTIGEAPPLEEISYMYDPERKCFMEVKRDKDGRGWVDERASALCYSSDDFLVWINPRIILTLERLLSDPSFGVIRSCPFPFVNGIWGSGKSYLARLWFEAERKEGRVVMFVGSSRKPTEEVREALFGESREGLKFVKTIGSALANGVEGTVDSLVIDEVCMEHSAVVYALVGLLKPRFRFLAGDFMQMPYVPFLAGCDPKYASVVEDSQIALLREGHRVPEDVYAGALDVYGEDSGIHSCDCVEHERASESMEVHHVDSVAQLPVDAEAVYLTVGQATKYNVVKFLLSKGFSQELVKRCVYTMAEFQGGTRGRVIVFRDVRASKKGTIYHEVKRINVGGSRSTGRTDYYTVSREEDAMVKFIMRSRNYRNREIVKENKRKARGEEGFGLKQLRLFVEGKLSVDHPALVAGEVMKKKLMD